MESMRGLLILFLILIFGGNVAFAYELVLPKEKKSVVNTKYAFFIGKVDPSERLTINDEKIYTAQNGAFAHSVKLKEGENRILIKSNFNTQVYKIYKEEQINCTESTLEEFEAKAYAVKNDNTPLRKTPHDCGMNRLSHLFKGTQLLVNGSKGNFYRVFLSETKEAWIAKDAVKPTENICPVPVFTTMNSKTYSNASLHAIEFTGKLPYTIEEDDNEILFKIYNPFYSSNSVYTINVKKPKKYTYTVKLTEGLYDFKLNHLPTNETNNLENLVITIDAGHGGSEKGAIGCLGDNEKDINLKIAQELKPMLEQMGATVVMTREGDANISLEERVKIASDNCTNIFISIHLNSIPDIPMNIHKNKGTSVYYYNPNSKDLAKSVKDSLTNTINTRDDGVRNASFAVIRPSNYIGILVETAYMTNPNDSVLYTKPDFPYNTAKGIAEGIFNFVVQE